jgi:hypothetical protein
MHAADFAQLSIVARRSQPTFLHIAGRTSILLLSCRGSKVQSPGVKLTSGIRGQFVA